MSPFFSLHIYLGLVIFLTLAILAASALFPPLSKPPAKFLPYESGIKTTTNLLEKRFPLRHFLVALMFLVFDIQAIFLYPWAVVAKEIGLFAFFEILFFLLILSGGLAYVIKKGALDG